MNYASWISSFENFKNCVLGGQLKGSDGAGVFWTKVNHFLRFLSEEEKDDDPDVVKLRKLFEKYVVFEGEELKRARLEILDLCLQICEEVQKRKHVAAIVSAL